MASNRVYSTESGRICPQCDSAIGLCRCKRGNGENKNSSQAVATQNLPKDGIVRLTRDTRGRKGAGATLINGLQGNDAELKAIAKSLKQLCGCGGSIKHGVIEIQGDQREKIKCWLEKQGHKVKIAGG